MILNANKAALEKTDMKALEEVCDSLSTVKPQHASHSHVDIPLPLQQYDRLFEVNDPKNGGSFYLQSKIYRARETLDEAIEQAVKEAASPSTEKKPSDSDKSS